MPKMKDFLHKIINDDSKISDKSLLLLEDISLPGGGLVISSGDYPFYVSQCLS